MPIRTLAELFLDVAARDQPDCLLHMVGGQFQPFSATELADAVRRLAAALDDAGIEPGDRVALMAENGPHWPIVDFAALASGIVLVPIYPTLTSEQAAYVTNDCGARMLFVEGEERLLPLLAMEGALGRVERFVLIGERCTLADASVPTLEELIQETPEPDRDAFDAGARTIDPDDLATFIYTSGTTGKPKGVMLTHGNLASNVVAALELMNFQGHQTALSFLPLSHSFERMVDYCYFSIGATIAYAESVKTVPADLLAVQPHVFVSVPRVYEKILAKVREKVARSAWPHRRLFAWAVGVGRRALPDRLAQKSPGGLLGLELRLADRLVFSKIHASLGGRFEFAISGGAPLARDVAEFFWAAGVRIFEGYGLSETSPVLTVNHHASVRLGTVGPPIPGVDLRIATDGEVLARGPNIMRGYFNLPEATAEAIDDDGWFHTGDIGAFDEAGHLQITDRKKELIINAYGKNIAPAPIENALKSSAYVEYAVVIGDRRKFLSALLVPDFRALALKTGLPADGDRQALVDSDSVRQLIAQEVEEVNARLSRYQKIRAWALLQDELSIEGGELTPTQKVKRRVIREKYAAVIERVYSEAGA